MARASFLCLVALVVLSSGCSQKSSRRPKLEFELVTVQQQALEAISGTPTDFVVAFGRDGHSWERAMVFFNRYTTRQELMEQEIPRPEFTLTSRVSSQDNYHYEVRKSLDSEGYHYIVQCFPNYSGLKKDNQELALRNARNLARFIKDGTLEVSLLDR